jgi:hypothetical protein
MAGRCWLDSRRCWSLGFAAWLLVWGCSSLAAEASASAGARQAASPSQGQTQGASVRAEDSDQKCRKLLAAMVQALGGEKWLTLKSTTLQGRTSGFYQGKPTGAVADFYSIRTPPTPQSQGQERIEFTKKRDIVSIYNPTAAWEITFRGKRPLPADQAEDYFRRRDHSIETAILVWLKDPETVLLYDGQTLAERHLTDQVTLISASNDAITLQLDTETHLPLRRTFRWRDPLYKDKNEEVDEFDDYHIIEGIATPFTITRFHNGDMNNQRFLYHAVYNAPIAPDAFDADAAAAKQKH